MNDGHVFTSCMRPFPTPQQTTPGQALAQALSAYRECNAELAERTAELDALRVEMKHQAERLGVAQARVVELEAECAAVGRTVVSATVTRKA